MATFRRVTTLMAATASVGLLARQRGWDGSLVALLVAVCLVTAFMTLVGCVMLVIRDTEWTDNLVRLIQAVRGDDADGGNDRPSRSGPPSDDPGPAWAADGQPPTPQAGAPGERDGPSAPDAGTRDPTEPAATPIAGRSSWRRALRGRVYPSELDDPEPNGGDRGRPGRGGQAGDEATSET